MSFNVHMYSCAADSEERLQHNVFEKIHANQQKNPILYVLYIFLLKKPLSSSSVEFNSKDLII